jgi:ribonuclease D
VTPDWIQSAEGLAALVRRLAGAAEIAVDTEGDSLHHYPARLALVQLAGPSGDAWLVDPLAVEDLRPLGRIFGDPQTTTVLHAGDNDLVDLKRRHGLTFARIFDTSVTTGRSGRCRRRSSGTRSGTSRTSCRSRRASRRS